MNRFRNVSLVATVAAAVILIAPVATISASPAPSMEKAGASFGSACNAADEALNAQLGFPVDVCPPLPALDASAPTVPMDAATASTPCGQLPTLKCEAWISAPYDGPAAGMERVGDMYGLNANSVATTPDGQVVFAAGGSEEAPLGSLQFDIATLAYDAGTGNELWTSRWESPDERPLAGVNAVSAGASAVYVSGYVWSGTPGDPAIGVTLAYDRGTGAKLWEAVFPGGYSAVNALNSDGSLLFVVGSSVTPSPDHPSGQRVDNLLVAYDTATGKPAWTRTIVDDELRNMAAWRMEAAGDRVTYVASQLRTFGNPAAAGETVGFLVATYDASGPDQGRLVSRAEVAARGVLPAGIALNADGSRAFFTHANMDEGSNLNSTKTFAIDTSAGTLLWTGRFDGIAPQAASYSLPWYFNPIDVSADGRFVHLTVFGTDVFGYGGGFVTLQYDAVTGSQMWFQKMGFATNLCWGPCGPSISANPATGDIVVAANVLGVNRTKAVTWSYNVSGQLNWVRMSSAVPRGATVGVAETATGQWSSIVHSPDGKRVFVGGSVAASVRDEASSPDAIVAAFETGA